MKQELLRQLVEEYDQKRHIFAGYEYPTTYSDEDVRKLIDFHKALAVEGGIDNPYFRFTNQNVSKYLEIESEPGVIFKIGAIGSFSDEEIARSIMHQTRVYVQKNTMGVGFPQGDTETEKDLLEVFLSSEPDRVVVLVEHHGENGITPIAGTTISVNDSQNLLSEIIFSADKSSQIPTFSALRFKNSANGLAEHIAELKESDFVCPMRFWRQDNDVLSALAIEDRSISQKVIAMIPVGYALHALATESQVPSKAVLDTHDQKHIVRILSEQFGASVLGGGQDIYPTQTVLQGVLKYHYGNGNSGGYLGNITICEFDTDVFLQKSLTFLKDNGIVIDNPLLNRFLGIPEDVDEVWNEVLNTTGSGVEDVLGFSSRPEISGTKARDLPLEVVSSSNRLMEIIAEIPACGEISQEPFKACRQELFEFVDAHAGFPISDEGIVNQVIKTISSTVRSKGISEDKLSDSSIEDAFSPIARDFAYLLSESRRVSKTLEEDSKWIYDRTTYHLDRYVGIDAHRVIQMSRLLGLVPYDIVRELRDLKVKSIGASVAASTLDLMVAMGVENVEAYDDGFLAGSNQPRMPRGDFRDNGKSKVEALTYQLYGRNPYGNFRGVKGRVVPQEADRRPGMNDIDFESFVENGDMFLEVADSANIKAGFREYLYKHSPEKPVLFIADVADPFVGIEIPSNKDFFHQGIGVEELNKLARAPMERMMESVWEMIKSDFPVDHQAQFLTARLGIGRFWAQTPYSANETAAMATRLVTLYLQNKNVSGDNVHFAQSPSSLWPYTQNQLEVIREVATLVFER